MRERRILYLQYTNPAVYPSLQHSARLLAQRGWQVLFLGIRAVGTEAVIPEPHPRIQVKLWSSGGRGWRLKAHYAIFALWALQWTWRWRPQWLYVSDPEATPIASLIRALSSAAVLYHEHDSPTPRPGRRWMHFVYACRRFLSHHAALCILPNAPRAEQFKTDTQRRENVFSVWNCPGVEEIAPRHAASNKGMTVLYQGSLVPARMPLTVIDALARLPPEVRLEAVGYETVGHPGYINALRQRAAELNVADRVRVRGGLLRSDLVALGRRCDVGLAFQPMQKDDINMQFMIGASNKFYEYLGNGLALLLSDSPEWTEALVKPGYGISCHPDDVDSLANALRWYLDHPDERLAMGERGRLKVVAEWNYEHQFQPVLTYLERDAR